MTNRFRKNLILQKFLPFCLSLSLPCQHVKGASLCVGCRGTSAEVDTAWRLSDCICFPLTTLLSILPDLDHWSAENLQQATWHGIMKPNKKTHEGFPPPPPHIILLDLTQSSFVVLGKSLANVFTVIYVWLISPRCIFVINQLLWWEQCRYITLVGYLQHSALCEKVSNWRPQIEPFARNTSVNNSYKTELDAYNPRIWEMAAEGSQIQSQPGIQ